MGYATALLAAENEAHIIIGGRTASTLTDAAARIGHGVESKIVNAGKEASVIQFFLVGLAIAMSIPGVVESHSGGLNSAECHAGSKPYHCHNGSGGSKRRRDTSRSRGGDLDCKDFGSWREAQLNPHNICKTPVSFYGFFGFECAANSLGSFSGLIL